MTIASNGEEKARLVRGRESQGQHIPHSDIHRELGSSGNPIGTKPIGVDRDNGASGFQSAASRTYITGKIIRQLIGEYRNQVATKKDEIQHLETQIQEFETLLKDIDSTEHQE